MTKTALYQRTNVVISPISQSGRTFLPVSLHILYAHFCASYFALPVHKCSIVCANWHGSVGLSPFLRSTLYTGYAIHPEQQNEYVIVSCITNLISIQVQAGVQVVTCLGIRVCVAD